jgi:hypothetical protein
VTRVFVPFTEGHYYGKGKRPNTELADNSPFTSRAKNMKKIQMKTKMKITGNYEDSDDNVYLRGYHFRPISARHTSSH